jgi:hypothetical protein
MIHSDRAEAVSSAAFRLRLAAGHVEVLFEDQRNLVGRHLGVDLIVNHHHRRQPAGPEAARALQREDTVGACLSESYAQLVHELLGDAVGSLDVAGRAHADVDHEAAAGLEAEVMVEAGDAGDFGRRNLHQLGDRIEVRRGQVPVLGLNLVEHGDQLAFRVWLIAAEADEGHNLLAEDLPGCGLNLFPIVGRYAHRIPRGSRAW